MKDDVLDDSDLDEDALLYGSDDDNDDLKYSPSASTLGTVVDHQKFGDIADSHPGNTNSGISKTHVKMPLTPPATTHETGDTGNLAESVHGNTLSGDIHEATLASSEEVVNGEFESKRQGLSSGAMLMLKDTDKEEKKVETTQLDQQDEDETGQVEKRVHDEEDSDDDESDRRNRFRSERVSSETTKPIRGVDRGKREIPDTLEISEETRQQIENFDKQQREKRNNKWNRNRGRVRGKDARRGLPGGRGMRFMFGNQRPRMPRAHLANQRPLLPLPQPQLIRPPAGHLDPHFLNQATFPASLRSMPPPPISSVRFLEPPPIFPPHLLLPPPGLGVVPGLAPQSTQLMMTSVSSIPVVSTTNRDTVSRFPNPPTTAAEETKGKPIPTLLSSSARSTPPPSGQLADEQRQPREVVFSNEAVSRDSPKLSVKIMRSRSRSLSRSRSPSPVPRPSHRRTVLRPRRSRSPRKRSRSRRSKGSSSRKRSRRVSKSLSPRRDSLSPPVDQTSAKKPAKIHINPHFKGPRAFPAPASVAAPVATADSAPATTATAKPLPLLPPGLANIPPPHLLIKQSPLPNPPVKPPAVSQPITIPPPPLPGVSPSVATSQTASTNSQKSVVPRPSITVPPPSFLPPPGFPPPRLPPPSSNPSQPPPQLPVPPTIATVQAPPPAIPNFPPPKLPTSLPIGMTVPPSVRPPLIAPAARLNKPSNIQFGPPITVTPRLQQPTLCDTTTPGRPALMQPRLGGEPARRPRLQQPGPSNPVVHIRPVMARNMQRPQSSIPVKERLAPKFQSRNIQRSDTKNTKKSAPLSRLKPPPVVSKTQISPKSQAWNAENELDAKYKALLAQQAEKRRQVFANKARRKRPAAEVNPMPSSVAEAAGGKSIQVSRPTTVKLMNLATATKLDCVKKLLTSVAPVTDVRHDVTNKLVTATYASRDLAQKFAEKYNRYMLDLSYITVALED